MASRREAFLLDLDENRREALAFLSERATAKPAAESVGPVVTGLSVLFAVALAVGGFTPVNIFWSFVAVATLATLGTFLVVLLRQLGRASSERNRATFWLDVYTRELPVAAGPRWF